MKRSRTNVYLEGVTHRRLQELCAIRGLSKSAVVAAALDSFLSPDSADRREAAIAKRLDKLNQHCDRLARDQTINVETLALFIRYFLAVSPTVPDSHQETARAQGKAKFAQFVEQLARHLQRGGSLVKEISEEICPTEQQFHSGNPLKMSGDA